MSGGPWGRQTFSHAVAQLPLVAAPRLVLHDAVALGLSKDKLTRIGVPWGDEEGREVRVGAGSMSPAVP